MLPLFNIACNMQECFSRPTQVLSDMLFEANLLKLNKKQVNVFF